MSDSSLIAKSNASNSKKLLKLTSTLETGFPSPAADHLEQALCLEDLVVYRPSATFYVRVEGNAMKKSGIHHGDILIVDRSISVKHGAIIVTTIEDESAIRRFVTQGDRNYLVSDDASLSPILLDQQLEWTIWGVVTHVIHKCSY